MQYFICQFPENRWVNQKYNFDNIFNALMSLFVLSSKDGWVDIMYHGLDAVGIDKQVRFEMFYFLDNYLHFPSLNKITTNGDSFTSSLSFSLSGSSS